jgi:CheY-like chemotaxis protein
VLIVDDDPDVLEALADLLALKGYATSPARNGEEALRLLEAGCLPDVILLDLMMPILDGREFLERRARRPKLSAIPVVVVTATPEALPAVDAIRKPIDLTLLFAALDRATDRASLR